MKRLLFALRVASLLTLGPIVVAGSLWTGLKGGLLACPFPIPFIMCHFCPVYCAFAPIRTGLFYGLLGTNILLGRVFCGFLCPGGAVQDMLKLPVKKISLSASVDRVLKWLKYLLAVVMILLVLGAIGIWHNIPLIDSLWFWLLQHNFQAGNILIALVAFSLVTAIFLRRPWCRYLCPLGVWMSPFNKYSLVKLAYDEVQCTSCHQCSQSCPTGVRQAGGGWDSTECVRCLACYSSCQSKAFAFKIKRGKEWWA